MNKESRTFEGLWKQLPRAARIGWLTAAYARYWAFIGSWPQKESGTVIELDGRCIDGIDAFFCAIGEAINGPGGYFGKNLNGLADCAVGGFGIEPPWVLRLHHSDFARNGLGYEETLRHERESCDINGCLDEDERMAAKQRLAELLEHRGHTLFDVIMNVLHERGITVELI